MRGCAVPVKPFLQTFNAWADDPTIRRLALSKTIGEIASALLGVARVRLMQDQILIKEPGDHASPWHVDRDYWPIDAAACSVWVPLHDVSVSMGPIEYVAGSHRRWSAAANRRCPTIPTSTPAREVTIPARPTSKRRSSATDGRRRAANSPPGTSKCMMAGPCIGREPMTAACLAASSCCTTWTRRPGSWRGDTTPARPCHAFRMSPVPGGEVLRGPVAPPV